MRRDKYFKGYNPDFVSAYGKRDWQKDMRLMTESREALYYWLGQYAEASNEVSFWKGEATAEKERADRLASELVTAYNEVENLQKEYARLDETAANDFDKLTETEAREQKLRELLESIAYAPVFDSEKVELERRREAADKLLTTLYPEEETK